MVDCLRRGTRWRQRSSSGLVTVVFRAKLFVCGALMSVCVCVCHQQMIAVHSRRQQLWQFIGAHALLHAYAYAFPYVCVCSSFELQVFDEFCLFHWECCVLCAVNSPQLLLRFSWSAVLIAAAAAPGRSNCGLITLMSFQLN